MKKLLLSLLSLTLAFGVLSAQDAKGQLKKAGKLLTSYYNADPSDEERKSSKLEEAKTNIDKAVAGLDQLDEKKKGKALILKGEIYNEIANGYYKYTLLGQVVERAYPDASFVAFESLKKGHGLAQKKYDKKKAIEEITRTASFLSSDGITEYGNKNYAGAYNNFNAMLEIRDLLAASGAKLILETDQEYHEQIYRTALSAQLAKKTDAAKGLYQKLIDASYEEAGVYGGLYAMLKEEGKDEEAVAVLDKGRAKFPEDENLRIYEINYYLSQGKLDELVGKLKNAIESDPKNLSLYSTLGHVYDNLHQREAEAGNMEKSTEYFEQALKYYEDALKVDGNYGPAIYNMGALYYNSAAQMTREMKELEDDYSASGTRKYEAKKAEMMEMFAKALPFFQKSESLNPNDIGTLGALKEIYARMDDLDKYNTFKERLEKVQNGQTLEKAYFDK